jgi:hypothetical protein
MVDAEVKRERARCGGQGRAEAEVEEEAGAEEGAEEEAEAEKKEGPRQKKEWVIHIYVVLYNAI